MSANPITGDKTRPVRWPLCAVLSLATSLVQWLMLAWISGEGGARFIEDILRDANLGLMILGPILWAVLALGIFIIGALFLVVALLRRERPAFWLWLAAGMLFSAPLVMILMDNSA